MINNKNMTSQPVITLVFVKNKDSDFLTGYVQEIPGVVAQGKTVDDTQVKLINALKAVLDYRRDIGGDDDFPAGTIKKTLSIQPTF